MNSVKFMLENFLPDSAKLEERRSETDKKALAFLKKLFPSVPEKTFFTDSRGIVQPHVINAEAVCNAELVSYSCKNCRVINPENCKLHKYTKFIPVIHENFHGGKFLEVRVSSGSFCKHDPLHGKFGELFKKSGLALSQLHCTFENFKTPTPELQTAKNIAMQLKNSLIFFGKVGTGKTHLAIAIALKLMQSGTQVIFCYFPELPDELNQARFENNYFHKMQTLKETPCLILDDLHNLPSANDFLSQIIDYRYRHNLQIIITTNVSNIKDLSSEPIISRILEKCEGVKL